MISPNWKKTSIKGTNCNKKICSKIIQFSFGAFEHVTIIDPRGQYVFIYIRLEFYSVEKHPHVFPKFDVFRVFKLRYYKFKSLTCGIVRLNFGFKMDFAVLWFCTANLHEAHVLHPEQLYHKQHEHGSLSDL